MHLFFIPLQFYEKLSIILKNEAGGNSNALQQSAQPL